MKASPRPLCTLALCIAAWLASHPAQAQEAWTSPEVDPPAAADPRLDPSDDARHDTTVVVHVDSPEPVELQRQDADGVWRDVCSSPCDRSLAEHRAYRVAGSGISASEELSLQGRGRRVTLDVRPSSSGWVVAGIVMTSVGGATLATGALLAAVVAGLQHGEAAAGGRSQSDATTTATAGIAMMAIGAAAVVAGVVAIANNPLTPTGVQVHEVAAAAPTWREPAGVEAAVPKVAWVAVVGGRF
jgi:hypothetical protein